MASESRCFEQPVNLRSRPSDLRITARLTPYPCEPDESPSERVTGNKRKILEALKGYRYSLLLLSQFKELGEGE